MPSTSRLGRLGPVFVMSSVLLGSMGPALAQDDASPITAKYHSYTQLTEALQSLAQRHGDAVTLTSIGRSLENRDLWALRVALAGDSDPDERPALLLTANLDGDRLVGSEVALRAVELLLQRAADDGEGASAQLLSRYTLYVVPRVNPDAAEFYFAPTKNDIVRNVHRDDADRDLQVDEDGPNDLNGDGFITMMRVFDPVKANRMADPDDAQLDIEPDAHKSQRAEFYVMVEGTDDDGDGLYNEDWVGGVDLNRNFMHGFQEHEDGVGAFPLSEPESLSLLKYAIAHQNIAISLTYGRHDNLNNTPDGKGSLNGGAPVNVDSADVAMYKAIGESYKEITGLDNVSSPPADGAFHQWAYAQYGVPAFSTPVWSRPNDVEDEESADESDNGDPGSEPESEGGAASAEADDFSDILEAAEARGMSVTREMLESMPAERIAFFRQMIENDGEAAPGAGRGGAGRRGAAGRGPRAGGGGGGTQPAARNSSSRGRRNQEGDAAWLEYSTSRRNGEGFVEWTDFDHPQLGRVQIGGFVPYFRTNPPPDALDELAQKQADFILDLLEKMPDVELTDVSVKKLGSGVYEVKAALVNDGFLPAGTRMAVRNRRARPFVVRIEVENDQVLSGQRINKIWSVAPSGGRHDFRWLIRAEDGSEIDVVLFSQKYGSSTTTVRLDDDGQ